MSLTGIRDLTLLNTPPAERMPILTYVGEYDDRAVAEAIRRELLREGQVFYVHNRVKDIEKTANHVRDLVPEARVAIAHGQLDEGTLEQLVLAFAAGDYDVLPTAERRGGKRWGMTGKLWWSREHQKKK